MDTSKPLTLYTFAMSHYSEKIRWTLDQLGLPYQEVCMTPVFHIGPALRLGGRGQTTLPILQSGQEAIQDSTRILDWLIRHHGPLPLIPTLHARIIRDTERRFDAIGKEVARFLYHHSFGHADDHIRELWTAHAKPGQATLIRAGYPVIRWAFRRKLRITPGQVARAQERITDALDWLEARTQGGRLHLVGSDLTTADITAAALLAPIARPAQHPIYGDPRFARSMAGATAPWQGRPGLDWVRQVYDTHRGRFGGQALSHPDNRLRA
jgi:glutathione S-transferase